jgi:hypothetical protein
MKCALIIIVLSTVVPTAQAQETVLREELPPPPPAEEPEPSEALESSDAPSRYERRTQLGISFHAGLADDGAGGAGGFLAWGLTFGITLIPHLTVGITRLGFGLGYSSIEGTIWSANFTPFVEGSFFLGEVVQPFGRLGVSMQAVGETNRRAGYFGASIFLSVGTRFWPLPWLSVEVEAAGYAPTTDPVRFGTMDVSPFSVAGTLGAGVGFHF